MPEVYDEKYLQWKGWSSATGFGHLSSFDRIQFDCEIKKLHLPGKPQVLEIGFGNGNFLTYAKNKNWQVSGIEANTELVAMARAVGHVAYAPAALATLPDDVFDLIAAFDVFEHIERKDILPFLQLLRTKLKSGGVILARYPNGDSPLALHNQNSDVTHCNFIGSGQISYLAHQAGLTLTALRPPAQPIFCGSAVHMFHRIYSLPIKFIMEIFIRVIFFPKTNVNYTSANVVAVLKK